jgi:hypothetical protein
MGSSQCACPREPMDMNRFFVARWALSPADECHRTSVRPGGTSQVRIQQPSRRMEGAATSMRRSGGPSWATWASRNRQLFEVHRPYRKSAEHLVELTVGIAACKLGERPLLSHLPGRLQEAVVRRSPMAALLIGLRQLALCADFNAVVPYTLSVDRISQ